MYDLREEGVNYYRVLGVPRASHPSAIKKAFKRMSLELHPDKNSSPYAQEEFQRVKHAHDVLMNADLRVSYDKMGEEGVEFSTQMVLDNQQLLIGLLVSYISQTIFSFIMTVSGKAGGKPRVLFCRQLANSIFECHIRAIRRRSESHFYGLACYVDSRRGTRIWTISAATLAFPVRRSVRDHLDFTSHLPRIHEWLQVLENSYVHFTCLWPHASHSALCSLQLTRAICGAIHVDHELILSRSLLRIAAESTVWLPIVHSYQLHES